MRDHSSAGLRDAIVCHLAARNLHACELFARAGMHFSEDGELTVAAACRRRGIDEAAIGAALASDGTPVSPLPGDGRLSDLCSHVVRHHHGPLRVSLGALRTCLSTACGQREHVPRALVESRRRLEALAEDLLVHFAKEENILFPAIAALDEARRRHGPRPALPFPTVLHPIRAMEIEHQRIGRELDELGALRAGDDTGAPPDLLHDCRSPLERLRRELSAHVRFEDDWLFARALELEEQGGWGW